MSRDHIEPANYESNFVDVQEHLQNMRKDLEAQAKFAREEREYENTKLQEYNQSTKIPAIYILPSIFMTFLFIYGLIMYRNADDDDDYKNLYLALFLVPTASVGLSILILLCAVVYSCIRSNKK